MSASDLPTDFLNPRKLKWTIYGSFVQLAVVFLVVILTSSGLLALPFDPRFLLAYGLAMSILSVNNTRTRYEKLDVALTAVPVYCPVCRQVAMLPTRHECPECGRELKSSLQGK